MWLLVTDNNLGVAPPCQPGAKVGRVLDVGTGSGIWALDFGDEHPESEAGIPSLQLLTDNCIVKWGTRKFEL